MFAMPMQLYHVDQLSPSVGEEVRALAAALPLASLSLLHAFWSSPAVARALADALYSCSGTLFRRLHVYGKDKEAFAAAQTVLDSNPKHTVAVPGAHGGAC